MSYTCRVDSPVGPLTLASDGDALTGLWMEGQKYYAATLDTDAGARDLPVFDTARAWLTRYFAGEGADVSALPPLAPRGSAFRQAVWAILLRIPYGSVTTYGDIAKELRAQTGNPASAQAVGGAVGHNPISIIIPCHRVVGAGGSLTGYAGGVDKKLRLLGLEGAPVDTLFTPKKGTAL